MKKLIFVVEDEESIRELYTYAVEGAGYDINCFESGEKMFEKVYEQIPNLFILDIMLEGMDGFSILQKIRSDNLLKDVPVIMVSAKGEEISKVKGLNLGADDYMAKPFGVLELVARINAQFRRQPQKSDFVQFKDVLIDDVLHKISIKDCSEEFTLKEYNLLKYFVTNPEIVLTREQILNNVWGEDYFGETRTLDMHILELRKKLADHKSEVEIVTVRGVGYMLK